jgi:ABC-2 type transport system permease protein
MLLSLTATGLGLIAACFSRGEAEAANVGTVLMMPLVFLSGAIFPMPPVTIASVGGRAISLYDIMPTTHAAAAMRRVLIYGDPPGAVAYELVALMVLSLIYLAVGVGIYQRLRLRKQA